MTAEEYQAYLASISDAEFLDLQIIGIQQRQAVSSYHEGVLFGILIVRLELVKTRLAAITTINRLHDLGDATYAVRERAAEDPNCPDNSWEHPAVLEYSAAVNVLRQGGLL